MNNNEFNNLNDTVSGVDSVPKKKTGTKIAAGIAAVAVIAGGGGIAAYNLSDYVKNQVKLRTMSPEKYYAWVNEENTKTFAQSVSEQYRQSLDLMKSGTNESFSFKYDTNDTVKNLLIDDLTYGYDEESDNMIIDIINNINSIELGANASALGETADGNAYLNLNDDRLLTLDFALSETDVFFRVAELTDKWLGIDLSETLNDVMYYDDEESQRIATAYKDAMNDPESVLSPEELQDLIERYMGIWNSSVEDVTLEKNEEVAICDITAEYTVISVEINAEKAKQISENFVNEIKNDELLRSICVDRLQVYTADEYNSAIEEMVSELDEEYSSDNVLTLNTYVDPKGVIRGISMDAGEEGNASFVIGKDDTIVRMEGYIFDGEEEILRTELYAEETDNKYTGNADFYIEGDTIKLDFTDYETVNEEYGYANGTVTISGNIDDEDFAPFIIDLNSDGSSQSIAGDINIEGENYGRLTFTMSVSNGATPEVPDKSSAFIIDTESSDFMADYVEQGQFETFVKDLLTKIGLTEEYSDMVAKSASAEVYNTGYDFYDDYYDYDDYEIEDVTEIEEEEEPEIEEIGENTIGIIVMDNADNVINIAGVLEDEGNSVNANVTSDGTYTVSYTVADGVNADGFSMLAVGGYDVTGAENALIDIKSLKIDGNDIKVSSAYKTESDESVLAVALYYSDEYFANYEGDDENVNFADVADIGEWSNIEITFEVMGME